MSLEQRLIDNGYEGVLICQNPDYEDAFVGVSFDNRVVYDYDLMIKVLVDDGFTEEEAADWIDFNIIGFGGDDTPIIIRRMFNA